MLLQPGAEKQLFEKFQNFWVSEFEYQHAQYVLVFIFIFLHVTSEVANIGYGS
jgi:hypothetical protein